MIEERDNTIRWLLDSDPAIRWQVMRDLVREPLDVYTAEREKVARIGWGHQLLAMQAADGLWGNSLYNGKWMMYLLVQQRPDGSWRPNDSDTAPYYEFETTLLVLEALRQFDHVSKGSVDGIALASQRGWRFLLDRKLGFESGGPLKRAWTSFSFPPYWFYDYLTALDCLRESEHDRDFRVQETIDLVRDRRRRDGRWDRGASHPGRTYFDMEASGEPSRWATLRALRVLEWWGNLPGTEA